MATEKRTHGIIDELPPELKAVVDQMLEARTCTYGDIVDYLAQNEIAISQASICRYARRHNANMQVLKIAQQNFSRMAEEMAKYPDLDTSEAIIRLTSQNVFNALAGADEEDWQNVSIDKMLKESTALIRATAYKKQIDLKNKETLDNGLEAVKSLVFEAMAKEKPELYKEVAKFLNDKKEGL